MYRNLQCPPDPDCEDGYIEFEESRQDRDYMYYSTSCPASILKECHSRAEVQTAPIAININENSDFAKCSHRLSYGDNTYNSNSMLSETPDSVAIDKIRKRRENHNAVERRRRDHINDMIQKLNVLVPVSDDNGLSSDSLRTNKGEILARTVEYIQRLKSVYDQALTFILKVDPTWHPQ